MQRTKPVICVLLTFLQIAVALPLLIYASNLDEFTFGFSHYLHWLSTLTLYVLLPALLIIFFVPQKIRGLVALWVAALALCAYLQANVIRWDYGLLDGSAIEWRRYWRRGAIDLALWGAIFLGATWARKKFSEKAVTICALLLGLQVISAIVYVKDLPSGWFAAQNFDEQTLRVSSFSAERNVVFILLDAFSGPGFKQLVEGEPALREKLEGFIYFKNTLANFPSTFLSIPAILTGRPFDSTVTAKKYMTEVLGKESFPQKLEALGYQSDLVTLRKFCRVYGGENCAGFGMSVRDLRSEALERESLELFELSLFRAVPQYLKQFLYAEGRWLTFQPPTKGVKGATGGFDVHLSFVDELIKYSAVSAPKPTFKFFHMLLPHEPIRMDAGCHVFNKRVQANQETVQQQTRCALRLALRIVDRLKELGVFDNSLVVILGDHGDTLHRDIMGPRDRKVKRAVNHYKFLPLLLMKPPAHRAPFEERATPALLSDVVSTAASIIGVDLNLPGEILTTLDQNASRVRVARNIPLRWKMWDRGQVDNDFASLQSWEVKGDAWDITSWQPAQKEGPP